VYVADDSAGLRVVDVSDPADPQERGFCDTPGLSWGVTVAGGYAYVADLDSGLRVIAVFDPGSPEERGYYNTPGPAFGVAVAGGYAYVASDTAGLQIVEFYGAGIEESPKPQATSRQRRFCPGRPASSVWHRASSWTRWGGGWSARSQVSTSCVRRLA